MWRKPAGDGQTLPPGLVERWKAEQAELRAKMVVAPLPDVPRYVAGADAAFVNPGDGPEGGAGRVVACALVYDRVERRAVEVAHAVRPLEVPYVPTFLSFREGPAVAEAIRKLTHPFGVVCFDGQGYAHPRRCGLAVHLGVTLDVPAIGCGKSRLIGTYDELGDQPGDTSALMHAGEQVGLVLRTKVRTNPVFVSVGHRVDLPSAVRVLQACLTKYRIPEPTRLADIEVAKVKKRVLAGVA
ncbi:MAG: Endonuclease [Phycisphaerales bacterium]|nr:Endonuclease [Phycisphaerales bacterium]